MAEVFDEEQNFTCRSCGECCRRAFDIIVSDSEKERYDAENVGRWFRESSGAGEGVSASPFEPVAAGLP